MAVNYSNNHNLPISVAVWLMDSGYNFVPDDYSFSATELLKSVKQIILGRRISKLDANERPDVDLMQLVASRTGHALHDSIEASWQKPDLVAKLQMLNLPEHVAKKFVINPPLDNIPEGCIPVFTELRGSKKIGKYTISGEFDFCYNGQLSDFKETKTYSYSTDLNEHHYIWQGSIYRWIFPDIITNPTTEIVFIFKDWKEEFISMPNYPSAPMRSKKYKLKDIPVVELALRQKLQKIETYWDADEADMPKCTDEQLWKKPDSYRYYKSPANVGKRSTANFDSYTDAVMRYEKDGKVGVIETVYGKIEACKYCPSFPICKQKDEYLINGSLTP